MEMDFWLVSLSSLLKVYFLGLPVVFVVILDEVFQGHGH